MGVWCTASCGQNEYYNNNIFFFTCFTDEKKKEKMDQQNVFSSLASQGLLYKSFKILFFFIHLKLVPIKNPFDTQPFLCPVFS